MLNIGVIGYGYWGPNLVRNFSQNPSTRVAMVADLSERRRGLVKQHYPDIATVTDPLELIRSPRIDAVAVAVPVRHHYDLTKAALEAGKHVWVEKPMTITIKQAEECIQIAEREGLTLIVDHTFLYTGAVRKMKNLVTSGEIGHLWYFDSVRINLGLFQHDVNVLWDLAPHDLSIMQFLVGRSPLSLTAVGSSHTGNGIADIAYLNLDFGNQFMANIHVNWLAPVKVRQTLVGGSRKMLIYNDLEPVEKIKIYDKGINIAHDDVEGRHQTLIQYRTGDMRAPVIPNQEALALEVEDFVTCIKTGARPVSDGLTGLEVVRILEASEKSLQCGGARVTLSQS